ncbi:MAG: hypothetical protein IJ679_09400 [Lachnospiraceae bacterium]|nr:hypothetical protein [Lachnospiraceae bacterium]
MEERPGYAQRAKTEAKFEPSFFGGDPSSKNIDFSVNMATNDNSRNMTVDYVYNMANEVKDIMVNLVPNTSETDYYDLRSNGYGTFLEKTRDVEPSDTSTIQNEKQDSFTSGKASGQSQPTSGTTRQLTYTDTEIKTVTTTKTTNFGKRYVSSSNGKEYELKDVKKTVTTVEQHEIKTTYTQNQILDNQGNWVDDPNSARQQQNQVDNIISTQTTEEYVPPKDQWLVPTMTFDGNPVEKLHEFLKEYDEKHDGTPGIIDGKVTKDAADRIVKDVLDHTDVTFDATDYTRLNWECEASFEGDTDAAEPSGYGYTATGEVEWRKGNMEIKIQHSSELSDFTTIPQFALDTKALGLDDADCLTQDNATDLIDRTKYAQEAVSKRRSRYGAIQNRLEHVYRNRGNQMENTQAAESAIRDADIADEMVLFSSHSIMEQAGQSMLAQANQSMQGALSILGA